MRATDGTLRIAWLESDERRQLAARLAAVSVCVVFAIALFLLVRRAAGALSTPLPVPQLLATAAIVAAWAICVRELTSKNRIFVALAIVAVGLLAIGCSYPGSRLVDWLAWGCTLIAAVGLPTKIRSRVKSPTQRTTRVADLESDSELVLQQLTRVRTDEGQDAIRGTLIGEFAPGERQVTLHAAFCPPFERLPQVEVNVTDDSNATVKLSQVLHNGVQLEVRLTNPAAEATTVAIEFFATDAAQN
jgi:hypothetical protein